MIALGETELAAGPAAPPARRDLALVRARAEAARRGGREHRRRAGDVRGRPRLAGARRRRSRGARGANAPSVRSADALGWALTRAGESAGRAALGAPGAAARLARPGVPLPRGHDRARRRPTGARAAATCGWRSRTGWPPPLPLQRAQGGAAMRRAARSLAVLLVLAALPAAWRAPTRSATSRSTTSPRCRCRRTASTSATSSTRRRSRPSRSAAWPTPRCSRASARRSAKRLVLTVDGRARRAAARAAGPRSRHPPGAGRAADDARGAAADRGGRGAAAGGGARRDVPGPRRLEGGRRRPGHGTAVRSSVPAADPTDGLRRYPQDLLRSPADVRAATLARRARRRHARRARRAQRAGERRPAARATGSRARSATPRPARAC